MKPQPFTRDRGGPRVASRWALLVVATGAAAMGYALYRLLVP
jgi:hypothetical protein